MDMAAERSNLRSTTLDAGLHGLADGVIGCDLLTPTSTPDHPRAGRPLRLPGDGARPSGGPELSTPDERCLARGQLLARIEHTF
jgi:hypothetical protein